MTNADIDEVSGVHRIPVHVRRSICDGYDGACMDTHAEGTVGGDAVGGAAGENGCGWGCPILLVDIFHLDLIDTVDIRYTLAGKSMNRMDTMMDWMVNGANNLLILKKMLVNCNYGYSRRGRE